MRPAPVRLDRPEAGTFKLRLVKGGPFVAVKLVFGQPLVAGEILDRSPRWFAIVDGRADMVERDAATGAECTVPIPIERVWPHCARFPISVTEYMRMCARAEWARSHASDHALANPRQAVDWIDGRLPL